MVSPSVDPSGNVGGSAYVNPYVSPSGKRFNAGLYVGGVSAGGQRPPGVGGTASGPSGVLAGEALVGGESRDQPRLTLGGNIGVTKLDTGQIARAGGGADAPATYLKDPTTVSGTGSAQLNLDYYKAGDAPGAETSKTPRYTIVGEGNYSRTTGTAYGDATTPAVPGSSTSYAVGGGIMRNWRLNSGHTILSAGAFGGYKHEEDTIGKTTYTSGRPYGALVVGGSF